MGESPELREYRIKGKVSELIARVNWHVLAITDPTRPPDSKQYEPLVKEALELLNRALPLIYPDNHVLSEEKVTALEDLETKMNGITKLYP
jgi:hypothetical protein